VGVGILADMNIYEIPLYIHFTGLVVALFSIIYADHMGFSWIRGKTAVIPEYKLKRAHYIVWCALIIMIASGAYMAWPAKEALFAQPLFLLKMFFVASLFINALFVGNLMNVASIKPFSALNPREKIPLFVSGAISTGAWIGAFVSAKLFF